MENASNALLMAAGVLIGMLVIAIAVVLFTQYAQLGNTYSIKMSDQEVIKFNSNFTVFEGRENINIQEIVSLINFVNNYKEKTGIPVNVYIDGILKNNSDLTQLVKNNNENSKQYSCKKTTNNGPFNTVDNIYFLTKNK